MNYYEGVVVDYLRADRSVFVNTECCIQLNAGENPDTSGPHWYCDALVSDFRNRSIFLCEITYSLSLDALRKRLTGWNDNWPLLLEALRRDSHLPRDWPVRPWIFLPEQLIPLLLKRLTGLGSTTQLSFQPLITPLELVQPWKYRSWNRVGEAIKPDIIPEEMRT